MKQFDKRDILRGALGAASLIGTHRLWAQMPAPGPSGPGGPPNGFGGGPTAPFPGGYVVKAPPVPAGEPVVATIQEGRLQGVTSGGINYFRGIPFAEPPVGPLRFKPPRPGKHWQGVRPALADPPAPMQVPPIIEAPRTSEDCLYLNIWAPATPGPHPVYVFIFGGGNIAGYALEHRVQGASFARDGIVCVNIGYRVGAFGFMELSGLLGPEFHGSGNNGLRDQLLALEWIQRNIAAFGGDPKRVTIGGQSAGAINVSSLTASPLSAGLFRGAIAQSGGTHGIATMAAARAAGDRFATAIKAAGGRVEDLQTMPVGTIMAAQRNPIAVAPNFGVVDGKVLLERPFEAMRKGRGKNIALLFGSNRDEMVVLGGPTDPARYNEVQKAAFAKYKAVHPDVAQKDLIGPFAADQQFGAPGRIYADNHATAGGTSYVYRWEWAPDSGKYARTAIHGIETPFVWDNIGSLAARYYLPDATLQPRADAVHRLWVSFIRDGKPAAPGVPAWPKWTSQDRRYLRIADGFEIARATPDEMAVWSSLLAT